MSRNEKARKIARARLTDKVLRMNDVQGRLRMQSDHLQKLDDECRRALEDGAAKIERACSSVLTLVTERRTELVGKLREISEMRSAVLTERRRTCQLVLDQCSQSLAATAQLLDSTEQTSIIQQFSVMSQRLEDNLFNSLTLLDDAAYEPLDEHVAKLSELEIDIKPEHVLEVFSQGFHPLEEMLCNLKDSLDTASEEILLLDSESALAENISILTEQDTTLQVDQPSTIASNTDLPDELSHYVETIPSLTFETGTFLTGLVVAVPGLTSLTVQPYEDDLAELSSMLREHVVLVQAIDGYSEVQRRFLASLKVGQVCCARFSLDQCWYRARVLDCSPDRSSDSEVYIQFVDYGNKEVISVSSLLPLPSCLATLPAQALDFTLHNVVVPESRPTHFLSSLHQWLGLVLTGTVIQARVVSSSADNAMDVEVYVYTEILVSSQSRALLRQAQLSLPEWIKYDDTVIQLGPVLSGMLSLTKCGSSEMAGREASCVVSIDHSLNVSSVDEFPLVGNSSTPMSVTTSGVSTLPVVVSPAPDSSINSSPSSVHSQESLNGQSLETESPVVAITTDNSDNSPIGAVMMSPNIDCTSEVSSTVYFESSEKSTVITQASELPYETCTEGSNSQSLSKPTVITQASELLYETCTEGSNSQSLSTQELYEGPSLDNFSLELHEIVDQSADTVTHVEVQYTADEQVVPSEENDLMTTSNVSVVQEEEEAALSIVDLSSHTCNEEEFSQCSDTESDSCGSSEYLFIPPPAAFTCSTQEELATDVTTARNNAIDTDHPCPGSQLEVCLPVIETLSHLAINAASPERTAPSLTSTESTANVELDSNGVVDDTSSHLQLVKCSVPSSLKIYDDVPVGTELPLVVSHVVSPSCFYAFKKEIARSLESLESDLISYYSDTNHCQVIATNDLVVGGVCCLKTFDTDGRLLCRAVIQSVSADSFSVEVFCVDYGFTVQTEAASLFVLEPEFLSQPPVQCVLCSLADVVPVKETAGLHNGERNDSFVSAECVVGGGLSDGRITRSSPVISNEAHVSGNAVNKELTVEADESAVWSQEAIEFFDSVVQNRLLVGVVKDKKVDGSQYVGPEYSVLLYDTNGEEDCLINALLVDTGLAACTEAESTTACNGTDDSPVLSDDPLSAWDPMQADFLSHRNVYDIDDEDVGSALLGYRNSNQKRVCRFYNTREGCYDGRNCRFQHIPEGIGDQYVQDTYTSPSLASLPTAGSLILVVITAVQSVARFMVHIMGPAETLLKDSTIHSRFIRSKFLTLLKEMDRHYLEEGRISKHFIPPNIGELVAVWCERDGHWYRAIARDQKKEDIQVFYVDVGYEEWVTQDKVRAIIPEFIHLPVQAIECTLHGTELNTKKMIESKKAFEDRVKNKQFFAKVVWRNSNGVLGVELYELNSDRLSLNEQMIREKLTLPASSSKSTNSKKRDKQLLIPG